MNKGVIAALVRADMIVVDMAGDDALYDKLRSYNPKGEADVVKRFSRSAVNAERQHRENMAKIVRSLFAKTYEKELNYVEESVFGVKDGDPIMTKEHPVILQLLATKGDVRQSLLQFSFQSTLLLYDDFVHVARAGNGKRLVLFEAADSAALGETAASGDQTEDIQKVFMDLLSNLFHFKAGSMAYSLEPDRGVPLYLKHGSDNTVLNEFFFYVLSKAVNWQSMLTLTVSSMEDVQALAEATYVSRPSSRSGPELPTIPYISKTFVAYFEAWLGHAPYYRTGDVRAKLDIRFQAALGELNRIKDDDFQKYVARKLKAWYKKFPPAARVDASDTEEEGEGGGEGGEGSADQAVNDEPAIPLSEGEEEQ